MATKDTTTPDLAEFFKLSRPKKPPCRIGFAIDQLGPRSEAAKQLAAAVDTDPGIITNSAIVEWCKARGQEVTVSAVVSHRKGTCTCDE